MRARMRMPRGAGSARKKGDAGKPPGRILAANNNSLHWPESGPKTAAGIRPPNRCHVRSHFGLISGGGGGAIAAQFLRPMGADLRTHAGRLSVTFATETGE